MPAYLTHTRQLERGREGLLGGGVKRDRGWGIKLTSVKIFSKKGPQKNAFFHKKRIDCSVRMTEPLSIPNPDVPRCVRNQRCAAALNSHHSCCGTIFYFPFIPAFFSTRALIPLLSQQSLGKAESHSQRRLLIETACWNLRKENRSKQQLET